MNTPLPLVKLQPLVMNSDWSLSPDERWKLNNYQVQKVKYVALNIK